MSAMGKKTPRKLALKAETLRQLAPEELTRVSGGVDGSGARRTAQCNSFILDR